MGSGNRRRLQLSAWQRYDAELGTNGRCPGDLPNLST